jgi:hypothetical protein
MATHSVHPLSAELLPADAANAADVTNHLATGAKNLTLHFHSLADRSCTESIEFSAFLVHRACPKIPFGSGEYIRCHNITT